MNSSVPLTLKIIQKNIILPILGLIIKIKSLLDRSTKKAERYVDGEKKPLKTYKEMKEDCKVDEDDSDGHTITKDEDEDIEEGLLNDLKKKEVVLKDRKKTKVKLSPADVKALTNAYGKLNSANKKKFEAELMKDKMSFATMLDFAKQT